MSFAAAQDKPFGGAQDKSSAFLEMTVPVSSRPIWKGKKGKGIPVFAAQSGDKSGQLRAERLVGHSEACHFPNSDMLEGG